MGQDRVYIDKSRAKEIRDIKDKGYLNFENQKEVFMLAMAMGLDLYNGKVLEEGKDALFNDRDLNAADFAIIYSLIKPELDGIEQLVDRDLVLKKAEGMADKGFTTLLEDMNGKSVEAYLLLMLNKANELYDEAKENGYFFD